jgi:hypothetical protein
VYGKLRQQVERVLKQLHQRHITAADRDGLAASTARGAVTAAGAFAAGAWPAGRVIALVVKLVVIFVVIIVFIFIESLICCYRCRRPLSCNVFLPRPSTLESHAASVAAFGTNAVSF